MIILDALVVLATLIYGYKLKDRYSEFTPFDRNLLDKLLVYHALFTIAFYAYSIINGGDARGYWDLPKILSFEETWQGAIYNTRVSQYMFLVNYFPSKFLGLSFFTGCFLYSLLGYWSFIHFLLLLKRYMPHYRLLSGYKVLGISVFPLLLFMPNLHFWSGGVGKDTLLFFCVTLFAYSISDIRRHFFALGLSVLLSYFLRPHITLFLVAAFGLGYLFDGRLKIYQKAFLAVVFAIGALFLLEPVMSFVKIESLDTEAIESFSSTRAGHLTKAGSGIDISSYSYPAKVFTFLYRPLFFDINNALALVASFENLILLLFSISFLNQNPISAIRRGSFMVKGAFFFFALCALSLSLVMSNLGIILRQKNMLILMFYFVLYWGFYSYQVKKYSKKLAA